MSTIGSFEFALSYFIKFENITHVLINFIDTNVWIMEYVILYKNEWKKEKRIFSFENSFLKF